MISGFCDAAENLALLGYYKASSGNFLLTFRDNLLVPSSGFKNPPISLVPTLPFLYYSDTFPPVPLYLG